MEYFEQCLAVNNFGRLVGMFDFTQESEVFWNHDLSLEVHKL